MRNIGDSLKKKVGPLPVWIWAGIAFILVWYYRNKLSGGTTQAATSLTPTNALPPQDPIPLAPGESVYDPNTGALVNTPGATAGTGDTTGGADLTGLDNAMQSLADALANGTTITTQYSQAPGTRAKPKKKHPRRIVKRKPKNKIIKRGWRARSKTHVKQQARHPARNTNVQPQGHSHTVTPSASSGRRNRNRPKTPIRTHVLRQRPVASHPTHPTAHNTPHQQHSSRRSAPRTRRHR